MDTSSKNTKENNSKRNHTKSQRIVALCGVIVLVLLYIVTMISAIFAATTTAVLFRGCLFASFLIPLFIFCYIKIGRLLRDR